MTVKSSLNLQDTVYPNQASSQSLTENRQIPVECCCAWPRFFENDLAIRTACDSCSFTCFQGPEIEQWKRITLQARLFSQIRQSEKMRDFSSRCQPDLLIGLEEDSKGDCVFGSPFYREVLLQALMPSCWRACSETMHGASCRCPSAWRMRMLFSRP